MALPGNGLVMSLDEEDPLQLGPLAILLRQNIWDLMEWRRWTQAVLAEKMGLEQPLLSKRLAGKTRFTVDDLERLSVAFGVDACDLLRLGHGKHDRRKIATRRSGRDRRGASRDS